MDDKGLGVRESSGKIKWSYSAQQLPCSRWNVGGVGGEELEARSHGSTESEARGLLGVIMVQSRALECDSKEQELSARSRSRTGRRRTGGGWSCGWVGCDSDSVAGGHACRCVRCGDQCVENGSVVPPCGRACA